MICDFRTSGKWGGMGGDTIYWTLSIQDSTVGVPGCGDARPIVDTFLNSIGEIIHGYMWTNTWLSS